MERGLVGEQVLQKGSSCFLSMKSTGRGYTKAILQPSLSTYLYNHNGLMQQGCI